MALVSVVVTGDLTANPVAAIAEVDAALAELYAIRRRLEVVATAPTVKAEQEAALAEALDVLTTTIRLTR